MKPERLLYPLLAVAGLVSLAMTALVACVGREEARLSRARTAIEDVAYAERSLERELLGTRVGLTHHYDKVNATMTSGEAALSRLAATAAPGSPLASATASLATRVRWRYATVEHFKTDNALLQNALARFATLSEPPISAPGSNHLSSDILRLTLDTSDDAVAAVREEIDELAGRGDDAARGFPAGLLVQARLLATLLPAVDANLRLLRAEQVRPPIQRIRAIVARDRQHTVARRRTLRWVLAVALLALVASTAVLLARGIGEGRRLRQRARNDHLDAAVANILLDPAMQGGDARLRRILRLVAGHADAPRAFLTLDTDGTRRLVSWPEEADAERRCGERLERVHRIERNWAAGDPTAFERDESGSTVLIRTNEDPSIVLGIEVGAPRHTVDPDALFGLRMALATIVHAARRQASLRERRALEQELARAERLRAIGTIATGTAHNVNNILGAIGGFGEMARGRVRTGSATAAYLDEIMQAVDRGRNLVTDILGYAGGHAPLRVPVDLDRLAEESANVLRAACEGARIDIARRAGGCVTGNPARLQQVLVNICNNAIAIGGTAVSIVLTIDRRTLPAARAFSHATLPARDYLVVGIADDGPGMDDATAERVFEPFFTTRPGGSGLGLSTAWSIVGDHGGTIDLVRPQQGCRFDIWIPLAAQGRSEARPASERVLLLAPPDRYAADEEALARLGYEPVAPPQEGSVAALHATLRDVDAVLSIMPPPPPWAAIPGPERPPLVLVVDGQPIADVAAEVVLRAPFQPADLARALRAAIDSRQSRDPDAATHR